MRDTSRRERRRLARANRGRWVTKTEDRNRKLRRLRKVRKHRRKMAGESRRRNRT